MNDQHHTVKIEFTQEHEQSLLFTDPVAIVSTTEGTHVLACLQEVEKWTNNGYYAAGYMTYEAGAYLGKGLPVNDQVRDKSDPLMWFGIYDTPKPYPRTEATNEPYHVSGWEQECSHSAYKEAIANIKDHIALGDTYQVNYTMRLRSRFLGSAHSYYELLKTKQRAPYSAYIHDGKRQMLSLSPELFFKKEGTTVTTKPMKGTIRRGTTKAEDEQLKQQLQTSEKDQAENVMIVDLLRNDLGEVAKVGSVSVDELFTIEPYPTVWQMTSTITAQTDVQTTATQVLQSLFPCGSITGAPKKETMKIIAQLESSARELYCGSIGYISPTGDACFNVAIRTATVKDEHITYGIGGGVTWDSTTDGEYEEALLKAKIVTDHRSNVELLESIGVRNGQTKHIELHLRRLNESATKLKIDFDATHIRRQIEEEIGRLPSEPLYKLRVVLGSELTVTSQRIEPMKEPQPVQFASHPVDSTNPFLKIKTTARGLYEQHKHEHPNMFDVLLFNERDEVTEFTIGNVVIERDGKWLTPPIESGLLPGVFREYLLCEGTITECILTKKDVQHADRVWLINSVREWINVEFTD
ncbi:hypothetical protein DH09_05955 [Bacillaceae bacterium JMAK1]|nr:hypothetical protein DH09_05955 [Bacillaceae bacterium JMAK1]